MILIISLSYSSAYFHYLYYSWNYISVKYPNVIWLSQTGASFNKLSGGEPNHNCNNEGTKEPPRSNETPPFCQAHLRFPFAASACEVFRRERRHPSPHRMCCRANTSPRRLPASDRLLGCGGVLNYISYTWVRFKALMCLLSLFGYHFVVFFVNALKIFNGGFVPV